MWYVCTVEYYSALKNDITKFAGKWKKPEKIILSAVTQNQNDK